MKKKTWIVTMKVVDRPETGDPYFTKQEILNNVTKVDLFDGLIVTSLTAKVQK